ncbi:MAG TPA: SEC-C domain-containing protein [Actinomycetota bacterium]|nr:SEC-C domain-containing protein [Actinomycetota bacterium]
MDIAKARFLFGSDFDPDDGLDPDVPGDREKLLAESPAEWDEETQPWLAVIATQVDAEDPPEVWATAQRLLAAGMEPEDVLDELCGALELATEAAAVEERDLDVGAYVASLASLPVPEVLQLVAAVRATLMQTRYGMAEASCVNQALLRLGRGSDDTLTRHALAGVINDLVAGGQLESLAGDRILLAREAIKGSVLTHRLTAAELAGDVLAVSDLAGLELVDEGYSFVEVDGAEHLHGPEGWLADFSPGELVALRPEQSSPTCARVDEPAGDPALVARVRAAFDAELARFGLPVPLQRICLTLIVEDHETFAHPRLPLTELCRAAGLGVRDNLAADHPNQWRDARLVGWMGEVMDEFEEQDDVQALLRAFDCVERPDRTPEKLRRVLDDLADPERALFVTTQLGSWVDPDAEPARTEFAEALLRAARRPEQIAVAAWVAAAMAEARGDVLAGEAYVRQSVSAPAQWPLALEWAGWYASDRGNAAEAAAYWRRLDPLPTEDLAVVEGFARAGAPQLGRNDPCWCGSGRKFKACHLGRPLLAPLAERVPWLYEKAWMYATRSGEAFFRDLLRYGEAIAQDPEDAEAVRRAAQDPLTIDVLLHEGGWWARFVAARGPLLPEDEARLAAVWALSGRTVYKVTGTDPGGRLDLEDVRSGQRLSVRGAGDSAGATAGEMLCARVVPDGEGTVFAGPPFPVSEELLPLVLLACEEADGLLICRLSLVGRAGGHTAGAGEEEAD